MTSMDYEVIENRIVDLLVQFTAKRESRIRESHDLVAEGIIDSLVTVHMILACEDEFDVTIYPDDARDLTTVPLIAGHIRNSLAKP